MGINAAGLGHALKRLRFQNAAEKKKVLNNPLDPDDRENEEFDAAGTSNNEMSATPNLPEPDMGENVSAQSYDVRANQVIPKENLIDLNEFRKTSGRRRPLGGNDFPANLIESYQDYDSNTEKEEAAQAENPTEEENIWTRFGRALANQSQTNAVPLKPVYQGENQPEAPAPQTPPIETAQVDMQEGLPPVTASEEVYAQDNLNQSPEPLESNAPQQIAQPEKNIQEPPEREPGTYVEVGAAQDVFEDENASPELKAEIERIFDTQLNAQRMQEINEFEKVVDAYVKKLDGVETALSDREQRLLSKVENRNLSRSEQISMVLALLAPAILTGLIAGKEGFAYGLAEGGKTIGANLSQRQKEIGEAEELLPEIAAERAKVAKEKMLTGEKSEEMKRKIRESVPNHALKQLFTRDGKILNGKLVLDTGNPMLPLKSTAVRTAKDFDEFREKKMPQLAEKVSTTEQGLHLLDNLNELIDIAEKQKEGIQYDYVPYYDTLSDSFKAFIPAGRDTFIDENGNKVKISELYETNLEQLSDMYSQAVGAAGSKTAFKTYREHFREMIPNPFTAKSFIQGKSQLPTLKSQINSVKDKFEDNIIKKLEAAGVDTDPIKEIFSKTEINTGQSEDKRKKQRANEAVKQTLGK